MMEKIDISKLSLQEKKKIRDAEKDCQKILKEIKPFIKVRKLRQHSTAGKWKASSSEL